MNDTEIEKLNAVMAELNALSATSKYTSAKAELKHNPYSVRREGVSIYRFSVECELQTYLDHELLEVGFSKAIFDNGREDHIYFYTPNIYKDMEIIYFNSLDEAIQPFLDRAKSLWHRGELLSHLHYYDNSDLNFIENIYETGFIDQQTTDKALELSVLSGKPFIHYFLSKGADITANSNEALNEACRIGELDLVRYLIEQGADPLENESILVSAREGHIDIVEYLLSFGASEATARTYGNGAVDQYFQAKDFAQKLEHDLEEKTTTKERGKI